MEVTRTVPPADAAAPFTLRGLDVSVALTATGPNAVDVLPLVTDNRWRPADEALSAWGCEHAVATPAFPAQARAGARSTDQD